MSQSRVLKKSHRKSIAVILVLLFAVTVVTFPLIFSPVERDVIEEPANIE